jgi:hypothetical protein
MHTVASWGKRSDDHPLGLWLSLRPRAKTSTNRGYADQVSPFVDQCGDMLLRDVDVELALDWLEVRRMRWTLNGLRAMFTDARRAGHIERNPLAAADHRRACGVVQHRIEYAGPVAEQVEHAVGGSRS